MSSAPNGESYDEFDVLAARCDQEQFLESVRSCHRCHSELALTLAYAHDLGVDLAWVLGHLVGQEKAARFGDGLFSWSTTRSSIGERHETSLRRDQ